MTLPDPRNGDYPIDLLEYHSGDEQEDLQMTDEAMFALSYHLRKAYMLLDYNAEFLWRGGQHGDGGQVRVTKVVDDLRLATGIAAMLSDVLTRCPPLPDLRPNDRTKRPDPSRATLRSR